MNKRFHISFFTVVATALLLASCRQVTRSIKDTFNPSPKGISRIFRAANNGRVTGFTADRKALAEAEQALRALPQYQNSVIYLHNVIHFYDNGVITAELRHPTNPDFIDAYTYDKGEWSSPQAVQLPASHNIASELIPLDSVPFTTAATVLQLYNEKAATIEGAKATDDVYLAIRNNTSRWHPSEIKGARERWNITFRRDGTLASFERR